MFISHSRPLSAILLAASLAAPASAQDTMDQAYQAALAQVRASPASAEASFQLAQVAAQTGDYRGTISALERILILNPTLANIKLELGVLYLREGSPALAEFYIAEALDSPDVPPEVRARAEELQGSAVDAGQRLRMAGSMTAGLISDSNANSGPAAGTTIGALTIAPEDSKQSDTSGFAAASGRLRYDLGLQAGHLLALDVDVYTRRYGEQTDLDLTRIGVAAGVDLNTARFFGFPSDILLRYAAAQTSRDGEDYLTTTGPSVTFRTGLANGIQANAQIYVFDQEFVPTTAVPTNDSRDGREAGLSLTLSRAIDDKSVADVTIAGVDKTAEVGFEAYQELSIAANYSRQIDPLFDFGADDWVLGFGGQIAKRDYDAPDLVISATDAQSDKTLSVNASLSIPLSDASSLRTEIGYISQTSNYDLDEYDNSYISVSFSRRF